MIGVAPSELVFLKIGGSLFGDKRKPNSFRAGVVERIAREIVAARRQRPWMQLLLAHGGGPLSHHVAHRFRAREGLPGGGGWEGFARTREAVLRTNLRMLRALELGGLQPILMPPSAGVLAENGRARRWDLTTLAALLKAGQVPMIHGDVVLDANIGFTILSTEELLDFLAPRLKPSRVLLACDVEGVYLHPCGKGARRIVPRIGPDNIRLVRGGLMTACGCDVTGGMSAKVERLYALVRRRPALEAVILSGLKPRAIRSALLGRSQGTRIV